MCKKIFKYIPFILVAVATGCGKKAEQPQHPPVPVVSAKAILQDVREYVDSVGVCRAYESVSVVPMVPGTLIAACFKQGDALHKGDLLYKIDSRTYEAALSQAEANFVQTEIQLKLDTAKLGRTKSLLPQNFVSQQEYDACESLVLQGLAKLEAARAAIEQAKVNLEYCSIVAPIDGIAGRYLIDVGNKLYPAKLASSVLVNIQNVDRLYVDFAVSENIFPDLYKAFIESGNELDVKVSLVANDGVSTAAKLEFVENSIRKQTGSINLCAVLDNHDRKFWPGETVSARVLLRTNKNSILVPYESVKLGQNGRYLFVIKDDKTVDLRIVSTGQRYGDYILVKSGVKAGEDVVRTGQLMLASGAKVMEIPDQSKNNFKANLKLDGELAEKNPTAK